MKTHLFVSYLAAQLFRAACMAFTHPVQLYSIRMASSSVFVGPLLRRTGENGSSSCVQSSKWDNLMDEDEEHENGLPTPPSDMEFIPRNLIRQAENFRAISAVGGDETINDVYARDPEKNIFWFVGKVARCTGTVSADEAVQRQWHMIEQHSARLRPLELGDSYGKIEIWCAPGNSELDVAFNRPSVKFRRIARPDTKEAVSAVTRNIRQTEVGFTCEIYDPGEEGFRTERTEDGLPANPEIQGEVELAPNDILEE